MSRWCVSLGVMGVSERPMAREVGDRYRESEGASKSRQEFNFSQNFCRSLPHYTLGVVSKQGVESPNTPIRAHRRHSENLYTIPYFLKTKVYI